MNKFFFLSFIAALLFLSFASAERYENNYFKYAILEPDNQITFMGVKVSDVSVIGFVCETPRCATVSGTLWNGQTLHSTDDAIQLSYPTTLQSPHGYGVYMFKEGYVPYEVNASWHGTDTRPLGPFDNFLTKKRLCSSPIQSVNVVSFNESTITVDISVKSPFDHAGLLDYVPQQLVDQYSTEVKLALTNTQASSTTNEEKIVLVPYSTTKTSRVVIKAAPGTNTVSISSSVPDSSCLETTTDTKSTSVFIPNPSDTTPPSPISNLHLVSKGTTWLTLAWTNPSDVDFSHVQLFLGGSAIANVSQNTYNITGLSPSTVYNIIAYTLDTSGNRNNNGVGLSATTLASTVGVIPSLEIVSPQNTTYSQQNIDITLTSFNAVEVTYSIDGETPIAYTGTVTRTLLKGSHTLTARAVSSTGNSVTKEVQFVITDPAPQTPEKKTSSKKKKETVVQEAPQPLKINRPVVYEEEFPANITLKEVKKGSSGWPLINLLLALGIILLAIIVALLAYSHSK